MNKFKIKPLKGFSLIELLVSIVIIAAITMLISSAFIGMMAQKKNLQVRETAEDMTREIISTVTRNKDNLDLLLKIIKTRTFVPPPFLANEQFKFNKYCAGKNKETGSIPDCGEKRNWGYPVDLTEELQLTGKEDPLNLNNVIENWLKFQVTAGIPMKTESLNLPTVTNINDANAHPIDGLGVTNKTPFRFFKRNPNNPATPVIEQRAGIFSLVDIVSLNMKMRLLPKNTPSNGSWNTKVFLYIASEDGLEPRTAADLPNKNLKITAQVKYSLRNANNLISDPENTSEVFITKDFMPTITEGDEICLNNPRPASCPVCRTNPWASGCSPCETYNISGPNPGTITNKTTGYQMTNPAPSSTPQACPFVIP